MQKPLWNKIQKHMVSTRVIMITRRGRDGSQRVQLSQYPTIVNATHIHPLFIHCVHSIRQ